MNDIHELKQFVIGHLRAHDMPETFYAPILDRIRSDDEGADGSWAREWSAAAAELEGVGRYFDASQCYNLARFPFVDGPTRQGALENCVRTIERWGKEDMPRMERVEIELPGGRVACWASGLSAEEPRPLLIVMGGIISVKEQWTVVLPAADTLGMAVVVTEMPGVGENTLPYDADSWRMIPAVLDAVRDRADVSRTYAACLSFSGHLTLRCATQEPRLRGLVTVGAPISHFFTDTEWFRQLPRLTVDTLAHLTGTPAAGLPGRLRDWALTPDLLGSLDIPVYYTASLRDEVIPRGDIQDLRDHVARLHLNEYDDVHGSPGHAEEMKVWLFNALTTMSRDPGNG
jgi:esterase FrsA